MIVSPTMRLLSLITLLVLAVPVHAASFYDHVRYIYSSTQQQYQYPYRAYNYNPRPQYNTSSAGGTCLYRNAQGECMIEQFTNPYSTYSPYVPAYGRNYLRNEHRYSDRDDDYYYDDDDDYYDDDDDWIPDGFFDDDDDDSDDDDDD